MTITMKAITWTMMVTIIHQVVLVLDHIVQAEAEAKVAHQAVVAHHPLIDITWTVSMNARRLPRRHLAI